MPSLIALFSILFCFVIQSLAVLTERDPQSLVPEFKCGNEVFREKSLLRVVKEAGTSLRRYRGYVKFDGQFDSRLFKVPFANSKSSELHNFAIVDAKYQIVGVISPNMVDESVDNNEISHEIINHDYPETSINYRKCVERPVLSSDALRAAYLARRMHMQKPKGLLGSALLSMASLPRNSKFNGITARHTLPITADGNYDLDGLLAIALDQEFNVIGATLRKSIGGRKCSQLPVVKPKIIGHIMGSKHGKIAGYECSFGYFTAVRILARATAASFDFEDQKRKPKEMIFPLLYKGAFFPDVSDPLYSIPLVARAESLIPVYVILKRSLDVIGVLEMTNLGFKLCTEETQFDRPESFSQDPSNRQHKRAMRLR